jgi:S-adenosylmethionine synthetase
VTSELIEAAARRAVREIGYEQQGFHWDLAEFQYYVHEQSADIARGVDADLGAQKDEGAGDQGIMFGYASDETPELMPLPILLAHRLSAALARHRKDGLAWLLPDSKTQVSVRYENDRPVEVTDVLVSTQHRRAISREEIRAFVASTLLPEVLGEWNSDHLNILVNPSGSFVHGGPSADCGLTGRKIIVDTYGGFARHGGGAFSGKDPSKVDRSAAYFCRWVARQVLREGIAHRAELQVSYAIGEAKPISVKVDTFGSGDAAAAERFVREFDFRPRAMIERLDLLRPIYRHSTNYGHFGRPGLPWED